MGKHRINRPEGLMQMAHLRTALRLRTLHCGWVCQDTVSLCTEEHLDIPQFNSWLSDLQWVYRRISCTFNLNYFLNWQWVLRYGSGMSPKSRVFRGGVWERGHQGSDVIGATPLTAEQATAQRDPLGERSLEGYPRRAYPGSGPLSLSPPSASRGGLELTAFLHHAHLRGALNSRGKTNKAEEVTLLDSQAYYKAKVIKIARETSRRITMLTNRAALSPERNPAVVSWLPTRKAGEKGLHRWGCDNWITTTNRTNPSHHEQN